MNAGSVIALATLLTVSLAATPAAAAGPDDVCSDYDDTVVVATFPTGVEDRLEPGDEARLYPGTRLTVVLCSDGAAEPYGSAWQLDPVDGYRVIEERDRSVVVEVTASQTEEKVTFHEGIDERRVDGGPSFHVVTGHVAESELAGEPLSFPSESDRTAFVESERSFLEVVSAYEEAVATVERARNGRTSGVREALKTLEKGELRAERRSLTNSSFAAAKAGDAEGARAVVSEAEAREESVREAAAAELRAYADSLKRREGAAMKTVYGYLGGSFLLGAVLGGVLGWWTTRRRLAEVAEHRKYSASAEYSPWQLRLPVAIAVLVLVATAVALVVGPWGTNLSAVIP